MVHRLLLALLVLSIALMTPAHDGSNHAVDRMVARPAAVHEQNGFHPLDYVDLWVQSEVRGVSANFSDLHVWHTIYIDVEVTSGDKMTVYIFDSGNYLSWFLGEHASVTQVRADVSNCTMAFRVPRPDTWFVAFYNDGPDPIRVEGWVGISSGPDVDPIVEMVMTTILPGAAVVALALFCVFCGRHLFRRVEEYVPPYEQVLKTKRIPRLLCKLGGL